MTARELADKVVLFIEDGKLDKALDRIIQTALTRRRLLNDRTAARNAANFKPDTKVMVVGNIKPKYLLGATGVVVDPAEVVHRNIGPNSLPIRLSRTYRRYSGVVIFPANCLRKTT